MTAVEFEQIIDCIKFGASFGRRLNLLYISLSNEETDKLHKLADEDIERMPLVRT